MANYREEYAKYNKYFVNLKNAYGKKPEVRLSINLLMTLLAISFFGLLALRPTIATISELISNVKSQEEVSAKLDEKIQALQNAHTNWTKEAQREFLIDQALPKEPQPDSYVRQLEGLVTKSQVSLSALSLQDILLYGKDNKSKPSRDGEKGKQETKQNPEPIKYIPIAFTVEGQYKELTSFMDNLENLRRTIKIETLSFGRPSGQSNNISLTITGKIPYYEIKN